MNHEGNSTEQEKPVQIVIIDDHSLYRAALKYRLVDEPDIEVVGEAIDVQGALELCQSMQPDLVLMDVRMPRMDGLTATSLLRREYPTTSVLINTMYEDPDCLLEALQIGAAGYILKDAGYDEVVVAIRQVLSGELPIAAKLCARLLRRLTSEVPQKERAANRPKRQKLAEPFTLRQIEVLEHLASGKTNREIAQELGLTINTVRTHVEHIIRKLGVSDRTQAVVRALELGIILFPEW